MGVKMIYNVFYISLFIVFKLIVKGGGKVDY